MRHRSSLPALLAAVIVLPFVNACSGGGGSSAGIVPNAPGLSGPAPIASGLSATDASALPIESPPGTPTLVATAQTASDASAAASASASLLPASTAPVLFADNFQANNSNGWALVRGAWATCPRNGGIEFCASASNGNYASAGSTSWSDYTASVSVTTEPIANVPGKRNGIDLVVRGQDPRHFYEVELVNESDGSQEWEVWRNAGGSWTNLARGPIAFTAGVANLLRVQAVGSHLIVSISRDKGVSYKFLGSATDTRFAQGNIALRAWGGMTASFDNVLVTQNTTVGGGPSPTPLPTTSPVAAPSPSAAPSAGPTTAPTATPMPPTPPPATPQPTGTPGKNYNAPSGTQPFPSGPFDAFIVNPQISPNSQTYIANTLGGDPWHLGKLQFSTVTSGRTDGAVPVYIARQSDPHYRIHCVYYSGCPIEGADVAIPRGARPAFNLGYLSFHDDGQHDQHMTVRNVDTGVETDMWLTPQPNDVGGALNVGYGGHFTFASGGVGSPGATAAGFALTDGRIRSVDMNAGHIPYALFLITPCENGHVAPAIADDGGTNAGCPPIGSHVWLDSSYAQIAASGAAADFQIILYALHEYGGYIGDRCTQCTLNVALEGGLAYTAFGLPNPWGAIAAHFPGEYPSGPNNEYHIGVSTGNIDLSQHLHVIY